MSLKLPSSRESSHADGYTEEESNAADCPPPTGLTKKNGLFGRSEELQALRKVKQQVMNSSSGNTKTDTNTTSGLLLPAVLVWGVSGTGKSHLIQQFLQETKQQSTCYILQGKCDEYTGSSDPFSALVQALNGFSEQLKDGPVEELERIRACIKAEFGDDGGGDGDDDDSSSVLSVLINVVPSLAILLENGCVSFVAASSTDPSAHLESESVASVASATWSQRSPLVQESSSLDKSVNESIWNRLQYIFLQFVKAISTKERPIYLFFDDLQWSSHVALELLANLVSDPELKHFLFLGSARQETNLHTDEVLEVATTSPLNTSFLSRLQSQPNKLAQITTQNLSLDDTVQFLSSLLDDHPIDDGLNTLAQKMHTKTQGNIFFTIQALEELQRKRALVYNQTSFQWEWNFDNTSGHDISISDNIIGVIESKLRQLPQDLQDVLSVAAYVGASFDVATLLHVVQTEQQGGGSPFFTTVTETIDEEYLFILLEKAVFENLLHNTIGRSTFRFVHDRIQQAAHGMVQYGEERDMLRLRIGHCLLALYRDNHHAHTALASPSENAPPILSKKKAGGNGKSSTEDDHGLLFFAADHLNSVPTKDHMFSMLLNLEVGERAIQMAALASAATYLERAANELKHVRDPWKEHYAVSLRLHRARCDVELSLGHFQAGYCIGDTVLKNTKTPHEKLQTYLSMAHGLGREDKHVESLKMCLLATTRVGAFPKRWYLGHVVKGMMKINAFLRRNDNDAVMRLPLMADKRKLIAMKLLTELAVRANITQNVVMWLTAVCQQIQMSIRFGLCEDSAVAFVSFGIIPGTRGDQATAMRCAGLAQRVLSKTKGKSLAGLVCLASSVFITPFTIPISHVIKEYRRGYKSSMETGDFELGFLNWQVSICTVFLAGYELHTTVQAIGTILQQSKVYRVESMTNMTTEYLSISQVLIGEKPIDWDEIEKEANRNIKNENSDSSQHIALTTHFYCRMVLATYFGRYDLGKKLSDLYRDSSSEEKACVSIISRAIFPGLNAAGRYRETGKRKHLRMLNMMVAETSRVADKGGLNFIHYMLMLKAELASIQKKNKQKRRSVLKAYDLAILVASEASFVQDSALTCELAGEHCIREGCSKAETSAYFVKAVGFYEDWGCVAKVDDLKQRRSEFLTGLDKNGRVDDSRVENDRVVLFGDNASGAGGARVDIMSSFTPSIPAMGASVANSGTKKTFGLQERNVDPDEDDDSNFSVLTDGFE